MSLDPYRALAAVYDDWQARYGSFALRTFERVAPLLEEERPPVSSFLDLGCGTGTLLLTLAAHRPDWRLCGVDGSAAMLGQARRKPGAARVTWLELPLGVPIPGAPFDAAGAFFNTLNHLPDAAALERALAAVAGALRPGALVAFDLNNVAGYQRWWGGQQRYQGPGWQLEVTSTFDRRTGQAHARLSVLRDGARVDAEVAERLFSDGEVAAAVEAAGFVGARASPWAALGDDFVGTTFWTARRSG